MIYQRTWARTTYSTHRLKKPRKWFDNIARGCRAKRSYLGFTSRDEQPQKGLDKYSTLRPIEPLPGFITLWDWTPGSAFGATWDYVIEPLPGFAQQG